MPRSIWIVRHGERMDNVNPDWKKDAPRGSWDDSPLTIRGHNQAQEVGYCLNEEAEKIDYIFTSPFTRCLQTTTGILLGLKKSSSKQNNENKHQTKIFVEPGFCESLNVCKYPPGYREVDEVTYQFPIIDSSYKPYMKTKDLSVESTSLCCFKRVQETLAHIIRNYKGINNILDIQELLGNILIVSHGAPISACHAALTGEFKYVGQCTISKYIINSNETEKLPTTNPANHLNVTECLRTSKPHNNNSPVTEDVFTITEDNRNNNSEEKTDDENNPYPFNKNGKLRQDLLHFKDIKSKFIIKCVRVGDSTHLSDRKNLRDVFRDFGGAKKHTQIIAT